MCSARGVHVHVCFNHSLFKWLRGYLFSIHWNLPKTKPTLIDNFSLLFSFFLPFIRIVTTPSAFFPRCLLLWKRCSFVFFYLDECGVFSPKFLYFGSKYHEFQMKLKMAKSIDVCTYGLHTRGHACTKSTHKTSGCSNPTKLNFTWEIVNICVPTKLKKKLVLYKMILGVIESSSRTLGDA